MDRLLPSGGPETAALKVRAAAALRDTLTSHPHWKLCAIDSKPKEILLKVVFQSHFMICDRSCTLLHTSETQLVTETLNNMHTGSMIINQSVDWLDYAGQRCIIWNDYRPDPEMLSETEMVKLTQRKRVDRDVQFSFNGMDPISVHLPWNAVVILVSQKTIGDIIESYDRHHIFHENVVKIVQQVIRLDRLLPILEQELSPTQEDQ